MLDRIVKSSTGIILSNKHFVKQIIGSLGSNMTLKCKNHRADKAAKYRKLMNHEDL